MEGWPMNQRFLSARGGSQKRLCLWPAVLILLVAIVLPSRTASASFLSHLLEGGLEVAGKSALRAADRASVIAAVRGAGTKAAGLAVDDAGVLTLTKWTGGAPGATIVLQSADDIARVARDLGGSLYVTPEVLTHHADHLKALLQMEPKPVHVVSSTPSQRATIELKTHARGADLVVRKSDRLTFSPDAWARRGLLEQELMGDLARRLQIIVVAPRIDVVQHNAFLKTFGSRVAFVDSDARLTAALANARQRLVVLVGHVENDAFVLRGSNNAVVLEQKLEEVHRAIGEAHSVALLMGCNAACNLALTGPTQLIDAFDVIQGLSRATTTSTPMAFLDQLASKVGSMHIDTDLLGRLRAVSAVPKTASDRAATGASFGRVLFSSELSSPLTLAGLARALVVGVPLAAIMGWVMLFFFGLGPRRAWRLIKETYASANGRGEHEIETLSKTEKFLLALFGPAIQILITIAYFLDLMIGVVSVSVAFPMYPWIRAIDPAALRIGDAIEQNVYPASSPSFKSGRGVALLGVAVAAFMSAAAYCATTFFHIAIPDNIDWMVISMILVASLAVAPLLTRRFPKLAIHSFLAARVGFVRLVAKIYWLIRLAAWMLANGVPTLTKTLWKKSHA
jgi:hypothetical protein